MQYSHYFDAASDRPVKNEYLCEALYRETPDGFKRWFQTI